LFKPLIAQILRYLRKENKGVWYHMKATLLLYLVATNCQRKQRNQGQYTSGRPERIIVLAYLSAKIQSDNCPTTHGTIGPVHSGLQTREKTEFSAKELEAAKLINLEVFFVKTKQSLIFASHFDIQIAPSQRAR
jgi:hypothetical protein